ncbi:MAG: hypothetical protein JWM31_527, partial [Solirubrobacterales bacterium]|nr:hypothetical protein [Solirubrobacterales bacterium]
MVLVPARSKQPSLFAPSGSAAFPQHASLRPPPWATALSGYDRFTATCTPNRLLPPRTAPATFLGNRL